MTAVPLTMEAVAVVAAVEVVVAVVMVRWPSSLIGSEPLNLFAYSNRFQLT